MNRILTPRAEQQFYAMIRRQNKKAAENIRLSRELERHAAEGWPKRVLLEVRK